MYTESSDGKVEGGHAHPKLLLLEKSPKPSLPTTKISRHWMKHGRTQQSSAHADSSMAVAGAPEITGEGVHKSFSTLMRKTKFVIAEKKRKIGMPAS